MKFRVVNFWKYSVITALVFGATAANAAQMPNPRSATVSTTGVSNARTDGREVKRLAPASATTTATDTTNVSRVASQRPSTTVSRAATSNTANTVRNNSRSATRQNVIPSVTRPDTTTARAASGNVVRSAARSNTSSVARSATNVSRAGVSRAASARATAVFSDISKIGGGYAQCREAYATCMDQFCANANDTYRRCFCSQKFIEFRDTEAALDEAKNMLVRFEDNNLNAVGMTASEVNAMYTATAGEQAIKNDVSGAAAMLNEIGELLSGKKKATLQTNGSLSDSLGLFNVDFTADIDDIWGNGNNSIFSNTSNGVDLTSLEGQALYDAANRQCLQLITESCENDAVLSMARSSYSILITQDCNAYEKRINSQREAVSQTVRTAEKYLREARLEEYRSHNSADVNECIAKVKAAITADTACGANYKKCLDPTGAFINSNTGEPIYSERLFQLENLISLDGTGADVLAQNPTFNTYLESRKMFVTTALDSCRDIANVVWDEFKRSALIEIAQAQDAKIEEVKMSCVSTMKECYNTQSNELKNFDKTTAQQTGALAAYTTKAMCQDKVTACAALYGDTDGCKFDGNGKLTTGNNGKRCGLTALLAFVDSVDNVRVAEGCASAIDGYVKNLCTPATGTKGYPWNCREMEPGSINDTPNSGRTASIAAQITKFAIDNCSDPSAPLPTTFSEMVPQTQTYVQKAISDLVEEIDYQLMDECEQLDGYWFGVDSLSVDGSQGNLLTSFYGNVFGGNQKTAMGRCVENTTMTQCLNYNSDENKTVASYDRNKDECSFTDEWYKMKCESMGGYFDSGTCYVPRN